MYYLPKLDNCLIAAICCRQNSGGREEAEDGVDRNAGLDRGERVEGEKGQRMEGTGMQGLIEGREHPDVGEC